MLFEVLRGGSNGGGSGPKEATEMQSSSLHSQLMEPDFWPELQAEYEAALALPPGPVKSATIEYLRSQAEANEAKYPKYWYTGNTERPKHTQTSSWVGNIRYEPKSREAYITMGDKEYTYINVSPDDMARLLTSPSIGSVLAHARPNGPRNGEIVYHGF